MAKQRKKRKPRTRPPRVDPDEEWNEKHGDTSDGPDWNDAIKLCEEVSEKLTDASDHIWDKAGEFFESVEEFIGDVSETITKTQRVSKRQLEAIQNMSNGVDKWLDKE